MKVCDIYYNFFKEQGYKEIFGLPGSYIMPLWQKFDNDIKIILSRHENGAVFMADGYSRNNTLPGIVLTTTGPGITNAITGITCAYEDSIPLIIISGYAPTIMNMKGGFQSSDKLDRGFLPTELLKPITKKAYLPQTGDEAIQALIDAYETAMSGRKGPVHISLPFDVQTMESSLKIAVNINKTIDNQDWKTPFNDLYKFSKKPIIFCGNGCFLGNATEEMNKVSQELNIPIISSVKGASACTITNSLYWGMTGNMTKKKLIEVLSEYSPDLVISLGSSLSFNSFNAYDALLDEAKIVRVDIDENQFSNYRIADLNVKSDVKEFLNSILELNLIPKKLEVSYDITLEKPLLDDNMFSKIAYYMNCNTESNSLFIPDAGNHYLDILYWCYPKERLGIFTNAGLASMGHAIGAAIGFKIANPEKNVICVTGDGSFMMSGMEISESAKQKIDITYIVSNNSSLGRARLYQEMTDNKIISTTYEDINISEIAKSLEIISKRVDNISDFEKVFSEFKEIKGTKLIEVLIEKNDCPKLLRR